MGVVNGRGGGGGGGTVERRAVEGRAVEGRAVEGRGEVDGGKRGGGKGMGWSMQITSESVAMICQTVEDGCYSFSTYLVSQQLSQYGQPLPLTVYSACTHHIWL